MADDTSITTLKASFIRAQVRQLTAPLEAATPWRDFTPESEGQQRLVDKTIREIVAKVNDRIKQHSRMVYPPQSQRHVAEQIESLHWTLASAATDAASDRDAVVATRDLDLTDSSVLANLPEDYDDLHLHERRDGGEDNADGEGEEEAERYLRLRGELLALSEKRDTLMTKLARYQHLCRLLAPLDEPQTNVQPNLVTRDGELAQELDRMRVLLARVTGKVAGTQDLTRVGHQSPHAMAQTDQQKLAHVLALT